MSLIVQKYGGSSVANANRIRCVAERIAKSRKSSDRIVVVVSALGDTTDMLINLSDQITSDPPRREMDMLLATGEQVSTSLLAMAFHTLGLDAISLTGFQVGILTDSVHTRARIARIEVNRITTELKKHPIVIVAGFQGMDKSGNITTLGRGGSDLTAVAIAKSLGAQVCEIYTDVDGIYSTDPRIVATAKKIDRISYEEMLELASSGAQVMQARSIELAGKHSVPIHVRSSFQLKSGTWIVEGDKKMEEVVVRGVTLNQNESKITLADIPDRPGCAARVFRSLAQGGINVDMIVQNVSRKGFKFTDISFTIRTADIREATLAVSRVKPKISPSQILTNKDIAKLTVVGIGMRTHAGVAADMFEILGKNKINILMISTSEIKISVVVQKRDGKKAVQVLHKHFIERRGKK